MNDFIKYIIKCSVFFALIIAILLTGFSIALMLFPQVLLTVLRYVHAAVCLAGGVWFVIAIAVGLVRAKMSFISEKRHRNEVQ